MSEKTTHWTLEELADIRARQAVDLRAAWARDERGHPIPAPQRWEGHICPEDEHCSLCVAEAWDCSAAVAFGLMGMAEAIQRATLHHTDWCAKIHEECGRLEREGRAR